MAEGIYWKEVTKQGVGIMDVKEALEFALFREIEAERMYKEFSDKYPEVRDTFLFLMDQETNHRNLLENMIREIK